MDTISRENNSGYLPIAAVILGLVGLAFAIVALVKVSSVNKSLAEQTEQMARYETLSNDARAAVLAAETASKGVANLRQSTQDAFNAVAEQLGNIRGEVTKAQELAKSAPRAASAAPAASTAAASGAKGPAAATAAEGEYVVRQGDSGVRIARAHGVSLADLQAVNPGVNLSRINVGQKLKLPKK